MAHSFKKLTLTALILATSMPTASYTTPEHSWRSLLQSAGKIAATMGILYAGYTVWHSWNTKKNMCSSKKQNARPVDRRQLNEWDGEIDTSKKKEYRARLGATRPLKSKKNKNRPANKPDSVNNPELDRFQQLLLALFSRS